MLSEFTRDWRATGARAHREPPGSLPVQEPGELPGLGKAGGVSLPKEVDHSAWLSFLTCRNLRRARRV